MKRLLPSSVIYGFVVTAISCWTFASLAERPDTHGHEIRSSLPSAAEARALLNNTLHHREWIAVPIAPSKSVLAWVVHPSRTGPAPVIVLKGATLKPSDWVRAISDQLGAEGYLVVVSDVLTEVDQFGNESTAGAAVAAETNEIARREAAVRKAVVATPAALRTVADVEVDEAAGRVTVIANRRKAAFALSEAEWPTIVQYLNEQTNNVPMFTLDEHAGHFMGQVPVADATAAEYQVSAKNPRLPADYFTAKSTLLDSTLRSEWVDIPLEGNPTGLHTFVVYPEGTAPTGVVVVMQHGIGLDDWQRALADQIARDGFIAVAPDLWSGTGPNGGNWDASEFIDDAVRAAAGKITPQEAMRRYNAARDYALKLPRANGKSAAIGFCMGGTNSFTFATEVPDLDAAVIFYGGAPSEGFSGPPNEAALAKIEAPVLGFYGENDARVTATVEPTKVIMERLGKYYEPHVYAKTTHSFALFQHIGENPAAIADAWPRTIEFFRKHLQ
jgi:carboxymethylenebutenolidase